MRDIKIDTPFMKIQYIISWIGFLLFGFVIIWLIAMGLCTYGKDTPENKNKKKGVLNMTYQKFIFVWGVFWGDLFIIALFVGLITS